MAFGFGFGMPRSFAVPPFSPASLFASGAPGTWYDPSDINLNWRYNLLTYTEQFDNAAWTKSNSTITANVIVAPDGTLTADKITETAVSGAHLAQQQFTSASATYALTCYLKAAERSVGYVRAFDGSGRVTYFDLANGTVLTNASGNIASIVSVGDGWYRCSVVSTFLASASALIQVGCTTTDNLLSYTGDGTSGIYIWGASLTTAANASLPYQQIVTPEISYLNYQPQPILYQDSAGTTPVTAVEQPVGLMLDKSQGLVLGPQLAPSTIPSVSGAGWTTNGTSITATNSTTSGTIALTASTSSAKFYQVTFTASGLSGATSYMVFSSGVSAVTKRINTAKSYSFIVPGQGTAAFEIAPYEGTAFSVTISNISVRELPGNHAFQSTAASRPVLSARVNQLLNTAFAGAVAGSPGTAPTNWSANGTGGSISAVGPETITVTASANRLYLTPTPAYSAAIGSHTSRVVVTAVTAGLSFTTLFDVLPSTATSTNTYYANGILVNSGTYVVSAGDVLTIVSSVTVAGTLSYRFGLGPSAPATGTATFTQPDIRVTNVGVNLPAYQRVNTATDYNTVGFLPYLKFDGVDDSLSTNSINFTSTDKMSVFAGVNSPSATQYSCICALGNFASQAGAMALASPGISSFGATAWVRGLSGRSSADNVSTALKKVVLTSQLFPAAASIADSVSVRINGGSAQTGNAGSLPGGGNFANATLSIGYTAGLNYLNGQLYSMIIVGKAVTAGELTSTETYTASKTGVTLA